VTLAGGKVARCESRGLDRYERTLAICSIGDVEINAELVRRGLAWAFVKYSGHYIAIEAEARAKKVGIWQAPTLSP
jgi:endonuclease YncB( thermonuclease family)